MSEEIKNATVVVPRSIVFGLIMNGAIGFGIVIATLFCLGDPNTISDTSFSYPFIAIFVQATKSKGGSAAMVALILLVGLGLDIGIMAAASRMLWSFARDQGVPGWRYISKVPCNSLSLNGWSKSNWMPGGRKNQNPYYLSSYYHDILCPFSSDKHRL